MEFVGPGDENAVSVTAAEQGARSDAFRIGPDETVMIGWFQGGEVFRSGVTYRRGAGRVFYFQPGHETYPTYHDPTVRQVLRNAVLWAHNPEPRLRDVTQAPNRPAERAAEKISVRGPRLHKDGEEGFR